MNDNINALKDLLAMCIGLISALSLALILSLIALVLWWYLFRNKPEKNTPVIPWKKSVGKFLETFGKDLGRSEPTAQLGIAAGSEKTIGKDQ